MYELEHTPKPDKNLINTVKDLEKEPVTSQQAQQMGQKKKDLRKDMIRSDETFKENDRNTYQ
ncbi:hypothetical protein GJB61_19025 [Paenibacillus sp. LC-T2]|uniref:Uncharacterized protein n=1 Tax=Paenibacillus monticola TaxID=2666075 RepID=A0A7X2L394_9BACL|nr:hypothetical protein [Paenibacillus monticola]